MDEQQPADKISAAAAVLRRLMAAVDAGEIEATTSQARAMLRRIEGAALALEVGRRTAGRRRPCGHRPRARRRHAPRCAHGLDRPRRAVRVFPGNTSDPTAFTAIAAAVKDTFALSDMVMVGDRGMITSARVHELRDLGGPGLR